MSLIRTQIPAIEGVKDNRVATILSPVKAILDNITGRSQNIPPIVPIGKGAVAVNGVIDKINEIINRLQEGDVDRVPRPATGSINYGSLLGNSSTASTLSPGRSIGGVFFDGSADITVASATGGFTISGAATGLSVIGTTISQKILGRSSDNLGSLFFYDNSGVTNYAQLTAAAAQTSLSAINGGVLSLGTANEVLRLNNTASGNRYVAITNSNGGDVTVNTSAGNLIFGAAGQAGFTVSGNGSVVNTMFLQARETGVPPQFYAVSDAGLSFGISNNTVGINFNSNMGGTPVTMAQMIAVASATNNLKLVPAAAGANPRLDVTGNNIIIGSGSAIATNATTGFGMMPSCAGTPTGAPTDAAVGRIPYVYDSTANKIWFYNGSWRGVLVV